MVTGNLWSCLQRFCHILQPVLITQDAFLTVNGSMTVYMHGWNTYTGVAFKLGIVDITGWVFSLLINI